MGSALTGLLIAAASTVFAAQSTPPSKVQSPPDGSTVTVTGCLAKGEPSGSFILTSVHFDSVNTPTASQGQHHDQKQPPVPSTPPSMTTPTTPSTAPAESAAKKTADEALQRASQAPPRESLRLAGAASQLKLSDHVGHTITATGMLASADPVVTPAVVLPDGAPAARAAPKPAGDAPMRVLNMRSFTHVAPECR